MLLLLVVSIAITIIFRREVVNGIPNANYFIRASKMMARLCRILHIDLVVEGSLPETTGMLASNHISWVDIPVVGAVVPSLFLSKIEVKSWPLIGWIAKKNGTLFIARGKQGAATQANEDLGYALSHGVNVLFFPEGTTTDGSYLRNFHPRLFAAAVENGSLVQPITLRYENDDGSLNTDLPLIGDTSFARHLWLILGIKQMTAKVTILPAIPTKNLARKEIALQAREAIHNALQKEAVQAPEN